MIRTYGDLESLIEDEPDYPAQQWRDVARWVAEGFVRPIDGRTFPLDQAALALHTLASREATGKITLTVRPDNTRSH